MQEYHNVRTYDLCSRDLWCCSCTQRIYTHTTNFETCIFDAPLWSKRIILSHSLFADRWVVSRMNVLGSAPPHLDDLLDFAYSFMLRRAFCGAGGEKTVKIIDYAVIQIRVLRVLGGWFVWPTTTCAGIIISLMWFSFRHLSTFHKLMSEIGAAGEGLVASKRVDHTRTARLTTHDDRSH